MKNIIMFVMHDIFLRASSFVLCPSKYHKVKNRFGELNRKFFYVDGIMRDTVCCVYCKEVIAEIPAMSASGDSSNLSWALSGAAFRRAIEEDKKVMLLTSQRKQEMIDKITKACKFGFVEKKGASWNFEQCVLS